MIYTKGGASVSRAYSVSGASLSAAYNISGSGVFPDGDTPVEPTIDYDSYTIESMFRYGGSHSQAFSIYNGLIYQCRDSSAGTSYGLHILDPTTGEHLGLITGDFGHCNSGQFVNEFYDPSDTLPLFYADKKVFRITGSTATVIKEYTVDSSVMPYYLGLGVDTANKRMFVAGYTDADHNFIDDNNGQNKALLVVLDMAQETQNQDGTYSCPVIKRKEYTWFPCIQGCCYDKGFFCMTSGYFNTEQKVFLIDPSTLEIKHTILINNRNEFEGCSWLGDDLITAQEPANVFYQRVVFAKR